LANISPAIPVDLSMFASAVKLVGRKEDKKNEFLLFAARLACQR
jgi:hypothetical protein